MICTQCGRPASRYTVTAEGRVREVVLCPSCYAALLAGAREERGPVRRCPACGMAIEDYRRTGLVGCAECYRYFRRELLPAVRDLQGSVTHTGKTPGADAGENYELLLERARLRTHMEQCLLKEDDAEAERLREQIKALNAAIRGERV